MKPHRGPLILVLGIASIVMALFSLVCCAFLGVLPIGLGIAALLLARQDAMEIAAGLMDPSGQSAAGAGKICGIVGIVLGAVALLLSIVGLLFAGLLGGAGLLDSLHKR